LAPLPACRHKGTKEKPARLTKAAAGDRPADHGTPQADRNQATDVNPAEEPGEADEGSRR